VRDKLTPMQASRVLVTGASGFLGQALSRRLRAEGWLVSALSRHAPTGEGEPWAKVHRYDGDDALWAGQDCVVHLAARVHVMNEAVQDPLAEFRAANVNLTVNLARQAARAGVRRFIFISSVKVNGEETAPGCPFTAADTPQPQDPYGVSKMEAERALAAIAVQTGLEVVVIRPPLVYGPGVKGNFASMARWVRNGYPLPLGAVHNQRSLVALDNLVDFIALCADRTRSPLAANQVFLISDGEDVSTPELLRKVAQAYGLPSRLWPVPIAWLRLAARMLGQSAAADRLLGSLVVDSSKARERLGWRPVVTMDEQLRKMALHDQGV